MRENMGLYRGKRKDNGEWVEGGIVINGDYVAIVQFSDYHGWHDFIEVIPDTAGQFAGLPDKNGKLIFEGDIVRLLKMLFVVEWHGAEYVFGRIPGQPYCYPYFVSHADSCEVIGNIHDDKSLLNNQEAGE